MSHSQRILIVIVAGLLPTASTVLADEKQTLDDRTASVDGFESPDGLQGDETVAELPQPEDLYLDCPECVQRKAGWRSKMSRLIDWCCLHRRFWRHAEPYHSCYKPVPPYHLDNKGFYSSSWRRLSADGRPYPPVVGSRPIEHMPAPGQSDASLIPPAADADFAGPPLPRTPPTAPALPKDEYQLPKELPAK
jgi:hypothetical protein